MNECKHILKYNSNLWTCGIDIQGADGNAHCGKTQDGEFVVYRECKNYDPVEKKTLSIAEIILRDAGTKEEKK